MCLVYPASSNLTMTRRIQSEREPHFVLLENKEPDPNIKLDNMPAKAQVNTSRPKETIIDYQILDTSS